MLEPLTREVRKNVAFVDQKLILKVLNTQGSERSELPKEAESKTRARSFRERKTLNLPWFIFQVHYTLRVNQGADSIRYQCLIATTGSTRCSRIYRDKRSQLKNTRLENGCPAYRDLHSACFTYSI